MLHVDIFNSSARVTDMTDAHKRGKSCNRFSLSCWSGSDRAFSLFHDAKRFLESLAPDSSFEDAYRGCKAIADGYALPSNEAALEIGSIRAIDAPREVLSHRSDRWSIRVDGSGISISDLTDLHNEPRCITSRQTGGAAYAIAKRLWPRLTECGTMGQASSLLMEHGAKLHSYCAVD